MGDSIVTFDWLHGSERASIGWPKKPAPYRINYKNRIKSY